MSPPSSQCFSTPILNIGPHAWVDAKLNKEYILLELMVVTTLGLPIAIRIHARLKTFTRTTTNMGGSLGLTACVRVALNPVRLNWDN